LFVCAIRRVSVHVFSLSLCLFCLTRWCRFMSDDLRDRWRKAYNELHTLNS
jgi:hypothetical protein